MEKTRIVVYDVARSNFIRIRVIFAKFFIYIQTINEIPVFPKKITQGVSEIDCDTLEFHGIIIIL